MEIVNKRKACQEILSTQKYLPDFNIKVQDFWICYYLKTILKADKNTARKMWKRIVAGTPNDGGEFINNSTFDRKWATCDSREKKSSGWGLNSEVSVYVGQIEKVKDLKLSLGWHKMLVICMMFYFKSIGTKRVENVNLPEFAKYVGKKSKDVSETLSNKIFTECENAGFLKFSKDQRWDSKNGEYYTIGYLEFNIPKEKDDTVMFSVWNPYNLKNYLSVFTDEVICPCCGKTELKNGKSQTLLCRDCYKKMRSKDRHHHQSDKKESAPPPKRQKNN